MSTIKISAMYLNSELQDSCPPEQFVVQVSSEICETTYQRRWREVNTILRLSMLSGLPMQLEAAFNMLCDFSAEMVPYEKAIIYFWDETTEQVSLRVTRGEVDPRVASFPHGNIFNFWVTKYGRPLLIRRGHNTQADALLNSMDAASVLVVPLLVSNRTLGSMQLFFSSRDVITPEDAQLLWTLALVAESLLTREHANEGLLTFAFTDYLTGLKTRGYFEQQLELEIKRCERKKTGLALIMVDIDFFKQLNDRYGHHVGDQVLRDVAALLTKDMREVDTVARYGGEEFVIILPETSGPGALRVAERLRHSIEQARFVTGGPSAIEHLTISLGIAMYHADARFKRDLIQFADTALYEAKSRGRNQVVMYSDLTLEQRKKVG
jgi:diguanylate cyclase (GGDEF)-like protein